VLFYSEIIFNFKLHRRNKTKTQALYEVETSRANSPAEKYTVYPIIMIVRGTYSTFINI
jgi:hypothetical protein